MPVIKQINNYSEIMFFFEPKIRYFADIEAANGVVFCAYDDDEPIGVICLREQVNIFDTAYLYTKEAYRKKGIAKSLMKHATDYTEKKRKNFHFRILEKSEYASFCERTVKAMNMQPIREMTFFQFRINEESRRLWEDYRIKISSIVEKVEKRTGKQQVISFADAEQSVLKKLKDKIGNELPGLNPFTLPSFDKEYSFIVLLDGEPIAFNAVRTIGNKMIYEISAAKKGMTTIVGVPVFFDKLFASDIERVSCVVDNANSRGLNHAKGRFGFLFKECNRQITYALFW